MSALHTTIKLDGKTKSPGGSKPTQKDSTPSPSSEKKLSNSSNSGKSSIPKSATGQTKYNSTRSQSSYGNFVKDKEKEHQARTEETNVVRPRAGSSKTPLGHNAISLTRHASSNSRIPDRIPKTQVTATNSVGIDPLTYSSPDLSPPASPPFNYINDDLNISSDNPEEAIKPPFTIKKSETDDASPHLHLPSEADGRTPTPKCPHASLLASKIRPMNKRPGHLRHMKTLSDNRIQTLKDYISIYEERLARIQTDKPVLINETKLKREEVINRATEQWMNLQNTIDQQYDQLIKDTQTHKENLAKELKNLEYLQKESSTLYDICDLEEDDNNLGKWVQSIKDRYNQTLTEGENSEATEYLPSISIERINGVRTDYESQIFQLLNTNPIEVPPVVVSTVNKREAPHTSTL